MGSVSFSLLKIAIICLLFSLHSASDDNERALFHFDRLATPGIPTELELGLSSDSVYSIDAPQHPGRRMGQASCVDIELGLVYVQGGWKRPPDLWSLNGRTGVWTAYDPILMTYPLHGSLNASDGRPDHPGDRYFHSMVCISVVGESGVPHQSLFLYGGRGNEVEEKPTRFEREFLADMWEYDLSSSTWIFRSISPGSEKWMNKADSFSDPMHPSARDSYDMWTVIENEEESVVVVFGGREMGSQMPTGANTSFLWVFHPSSSKWEPRTNPLSDFPPPANRRFSWKSSSPLLLFVYGGIHEDGTWLSSLYRCEYSSSLWESLVVIGPTPGPRAGGGVVSIEPNPRFESDFAILCMGAPNWDHWVADCWKFHHGRSEFNFQLLPITTDGAELLLDATGRTQKDVFPSSRDLFAFVVSDDSILMIGGWDSLGSVRADTWKMVLPCTDDYPRCHDYDCADGVSVVDEMVVCSGFGTCLKPGGACICHVGHFGEFCEQWDCVDGIAYWNESNVCSGHGTCESSAQPHCQCELPYEGTYCSHISPLLIAGVSSGAIGLFLCLYISSMFSVLCCVWCCTRRKKRMSHVPACVFRQLNTRDKKRILGRFVIKNPDKVQIIKGGIAKRGGCGIVRRGSFATTGVHGIEIAVKRMLVLLMSDMERERHPIYGQLPDYVLPIPTLDEFLNEITMLSSVSLDVSDVIPGDEEMGERNERLLESQQNKIAEKWSANVVLYYGCYFENEDSKEKTVEACVIMEFLNGGSLQDRLTRLQTYSPLKKLRIILNVAQGMHVIHLRGITLRDLALDNVMFRKESDDDVEAVVIDFGLSRRSDELRDDSERAGKIRYFPPNLEQCNKGESQKIDVWAFGVLTWEIWNGKKAFADLRGLDGRALLECIKKRDSRVVLDFSDCLGMDLDLQVFLRTCFDEIPSRRPTFEKITECVSRWIQVLGTRDPKRDSLVLRDFPS